jgi:hypothetical protein
MEAKAASHDFVTSLWPSDCGDWNRRRAANAIFYFATAVNTAAQEKQEKQLKALKEAETIIQLEQERSKYE